MRKMMTTHTLTKLGLTAALALGLTGPALADEPPAGKPAPQKEPKPEPKPAPPPPTDEAPAKPKPKPRPAPQTPAPTSGASAEVKAATGVTKREPVGEATSFAKGTKVWAWAKVFGAKDTTVKQVWKRDGVALWEKEFPIGSGQWRIYTRRTLAKPGSYAVDVVAEDGAVLGTVAFTVEE